MSSQAPTTNGYSASVQNSDKTAPANNDDQDGDDHSSTVGAEGHSAHSNPQSDDDDNDEDHKSDEADADGRDTQTDDHTQYYETNGSFTQGTHFGASSLPTDMLDLNGFSNSPPSHMHIHHMMMGATAPSSTPPIATAATLLNDMSTNSEGVSDPLASKSISPTSSPAVSVAKAPAVVRSPSEEARALEARQTQRRAKIGVRYKTKNCHTFAESGECKYGEACVFAHGEEELAKYIAIAEAAEAEEIASTPSVAAPLAPPPQTDIAPPTTSSKKTKAASQPVPAVGTKGVVATPQIATAPSKYRDALMKSVPSVAPSTPTASKKEAPAQPAGKKPLQQQQLPVSPAPAFAPKLTANSLYHHHHMSATNVTETPKRCGDYGFGASVNDERQRATEGNRRVPQEELERYRLERKAEAIARAKISETGSPSAPASPAPEDNDFYARHAAFHERSVSQTSNSLSEHCAAAVLAATEGNSPVGAPAANCAFGSHPPGEGVAEEALATHSNGSSVGSTGFFNIPPAAIPEHYTSTWDYVHQQQQQQRNNTAGSAASGQGHSPATSGRYSHNPYATGI